MTAEDGRAPLRLFRDGRFVDDEPAAAAAPLLAPRSLGRRLVGCGCLAALVLPLLLVALVAAGFALASVAGDERTTTTGVVLSVGPGTDVDGVPRTHCYEVAYTAGGRDLVHRTCEVQPRAAAGVPDGETREQRDARFAAEHVVGSEVRLRHAVEPPYAASGAIADTDVTLVEPGRTGAAIGLLVAGSAVSVSVLAVWGTLRAGRRAG